MSNSAADPQTPRATVRANGVELGVETFGRDDDPLVLLAGGTTMLSWPDSLCERLAAGGRRVVRYDLRDCGASTTLDPEAPAYGLRDLAADAAALVDALGGTPAHLGGVGVGDRRRLAARPRRHGHRPAGRRGRRGCRRDARPLNPQPIPACSRRHRTAH